MGYNTSPLVSVLLTMFNVRLGWWLPNPGKRRWQKDSPVFSLFYLIWELNSASPVVEEQLTKAGTRLAMVLNSIWKQLELKE